ncbi:MAG: hypothetical protein Q9165_002990 [Trypethelium subeluteriae]
MASVEVVAGFSLLNRWLLYTSVMLAPAQFISGLGSYWPTSIGFLAYNYYTQIAWYRAIERLELHALSLLTPNFNLIYAISYLAGTSSGTIYMGLPSGIGTAGVLLLNTVSAWKSWTSCMTQGYGVYEFFFFGWRRLTPGWHRFFAVWQATDSCTTLLAVILAVVIPMILDNKLKKADVPSWLRCVATLGERAKDDKLPLWLTYAAIIPGAVVMLICSFQLILWTELIVQRNNIVSPTDWIAVWLFIAQIGASFLPPLKPFLSDLARMRRGEPSNVADFATHIEWPYKQAEKALQAKGEPISEDEAYLQQEYVQLVGIMDRHEKVEVVRHPYWHAKSKASLAQKIDYLHQFRREKAARMPQVLPPVAPVLLQQWHAAQSVAFQPHYCRPRNSQSSGYGLHSQAAQQHPNYHYTLASQCPAATQHRSATAQGMQCSAVTPHAATASHQPAIQYPPAAEHPLARQHPLASQYTPATQNPPARQHPPTTQYQSATQYLSATQHPPATQCPPATQYPPTARPPWSLRYPEAPHPSQGIQHPINQSGEPRVQFTPGIGHSAWCNDPEQRRGPHDVCHNAQACHFVPRTTANEFIPGHNTHPLAPGGPRY